MATIQADYPAAQRVFEQALRAAEALSDTEQVRRACLGLGEVARRRGDTAAARVFAERALAIAREPHALRLLGYVARREGNYEQARALQEEALERWRRKGNLSGVATALGALARIAAAQGDRAAARRYFWESLDAAREIGDRLGLASALAGLGFEYTHAGDLTTARSMLAEALPIFRDLETSGALICLEGMAALDLAVGQRSEGVASAFRSARHAACLQAAAEALSDSLGLGAEETVRAEREARAAVLRAILGVDEFAAARAEGRALTLEQAIALALQEDFAPEAIDPDQGSKAA